MDTSRKILNVLGIVFAWFLSILLVAMLVVTPVVFSALSLLNAQTITKAVNNVITEMNITGDKGASRDTQTENYGLVKLSDSAATKKQNDLSESVSDIVKDLAGDAISPEIVEAILASEAAQGLIATYSEDIINALTDSGEQAQFSAEKLKTAVNDNLDEIAQIVRSADPEMSGKDIQEIKNDILTAVNDNADKVVEALPKPEKIKQDLVRENPWMETVFHILAKKDTIKLAITGVIVVLSALIFVCRLWGFRGFRWLAVDLFAAAGVGLVLSLFLIFGFSAFSEVVADNAIVNSPAGAIISALATGMLIRALVMLFSGGGLLAAYIFIKKAKAKKRLKIEDEECEECENVGYKSTEV